MSQVISGCDVLTKELKILYAPIVSELEQSESILRRELRSEHHLVDEMIRYGCLLGGKRLRPALLLLSAKAIGQTTSEHLILAAVVEIIHTATLIHDDVLDKAQLRRHLETSNARWDNQASVLLGDYLFTHAFFLASTLDSTFACSTIGKATNTVCEGELRQVRSCNNFEMDEVEYLDIIDAKTAALCACACRLGAHFAGASEECVDLCARYGRNLGIAFQIIDDLLDVTGNESTAGKSLGTDLDQNKPTLPLIHVLSHLPQQRRVQVLEDVNSGADGREILAPLLDRFDTYQYVRDKARWYADQAIHQINGMADNEASQVLQQLPNFVLHRAG